MTQISCFTVIDGLAIIHSYVKLPEVFFSSAEICLPFLERIKSGKACHQAMRFQSGQAPDLSG